MLKITKKIEYALIALRHLNENKGKGVSFSAKEISLLYSLPLENLAKTMQILVKLNYLSSFKGKKGGYILKEGLESTNLRDFVESLEGPIGLVDCTLEKNCLVEGNCNIKSPIVRVNNNLKYALSSIPMSEIIK